MFFFYFCCLACPNGRFATDACEADNKIYHNNPVDAMTVLQMVTTWPKAAN